MANRYWVGGTAAWDGTAGSKWALTSGGAGGQAIPTSADDVFFSAASGAVTCTISAGNTGAKTITCTGFTGTLTGSINISGSLTLSSGGTYTGLTALFIATATLTSVAKTISGANIGATGGATLTLADAASMGGFTLGEGALNLNGFTFTVAGVNGWSSTGTVTRSIAFGSANIVVTSNILNMANATNFTWTGTGGFVFTPTSSGVVSFGSTAGGTAANSINLSVPSTAFAVRLFSGGHFRNLIFTGYSGTLATTPINVYGDLTLSSGGTYTGLTPTFRGSGTFTSATKATGNVTISGSGITVTLGDALTMAVSTSVTLTEGSINLNGFTLSTGIFSSNNSNTRSIAFGTGNIALTSTTAATTVLDMTTATGFTNTGTGGFTRNMAATATVVFGTTGGTATNAPNLAVNAGVEALTITTGSYFKNLNFTGYSGTPATTSYNACGNLTLSSGGTYTGITPTFLASGTFTSVTKVTGSPTINGSGITVTLGDALTLAATNTFTLTEGTLDLGGFTLSTGTFSAGGSLTRVIAFGSANIALTSTTAAAIVLSIVNGTNFSWTGTGGFTRNMAATATVEFASALGGTATNGPNLTVNAGASALSFSSSSYFRNVVFTGSTSIVTASNLRVAGNLTLASGGTYTNVIPIFNGSGTFTSATKATGNVTINGTGITVTLGDPLTLAAANTFTLTEGTLDLGGFTLSIGQFVSSGSLTRSIAFGSANIALIGTASPLLSMGTATNFTWTGTGGFTRNSTSTSVFNFGQTAGASATNAPNLSITAGSSGVTIASSSYFKNLNFTGYSGSASASYNACGNLTLSSGGTYTLTSPTFITSGTLTTVAKTIGLLTINGSGITVTLGDASTTGSLSFTQGTLNLAGFTLTAGVAVTAAGTKNLTFNGGTLVITSASATAWNNANPTGFTTTAGTGTGTISMTAATAKTFVGGGSTYNCTLNQGGAGTLTITGANTFNDITNTNVTVSQITFPASTTTTVNNFTLSGTPGNLVSIRSSTPATQFTLSDASGIISVSNVNIEDSNATGGATWEALLTNNNVNAGNNAGWIFSSNSPSNMFLLFFIP